MVNYVVRYRDLIQLDIKLRHISDVDGYLLPRLTGKAVLDIGAAGGVERYLPYHIDQWLHAKIAAVASDIYGTDIDRDNIAHAARHGWKIAEADCEFMKLNRRFDAALMMDVIEHLEAPGRAIVNVMAHVKPGGALYIATPSPTGAGDIVRVFRGKAPSVYWDHQCVMWPEHLQAICDRHGFVLRDVAMIALHDERSRILLLKSAALRIIGSINPRLGPRWIGVVQAK